MTTQQLRRFRGLLICKRCRQRYDALATLSDQPDASPLVVSTPIAPKWLHAFSFPPGAWSIACAVMLVVLLGQGLYFHADTLQRQATTRSLWNAACRLLDCPGIELANADEWSISHSDLQPYLNRQLLFTAALTHQGASSQAFPKLKLTLLGLKGDVLAERIFSGAEYTQQHQLAAGDTQKIQLWLAEPTQGFTGFYVSLL